MPNAKPAVTFQDVIEFLYSKATVEERRSVSKTLNILRDDDIQSVKHDLKVGDKVKFEVKKRGWGPQTVRGTVTRKNQKTIDVRTEGGKMWKVTASLLQRDDQPAK